MHTRPRPRASSVQRSNSRGHTALPPRFRSRCRLLRYSSTTLRLRHARSQDTCRTSAQHRLPATAAAATHTTRATPLPHCNAAVTHASTQRSETKNHEQSTAITVPHRAAPSHSSHSETRCSNAHATTPIRNRNTAAHPTTHCARDSAGNARPKTRIVPRAYDTATMLHIFTGTMHTSRTCRLAPRPPLPSHRKHAREKHTRRDKPHPPQRHVGVMAHATQNSAHLNPTHATSHTHT